MRLRNKKTGEIWGNAVIESYLCAEGYRLIVKVNKDASLGKHYDSLAELNEDWEDQDAIIVRTKNRIEFLEKKLKSEKALLEELCGEEEECES